MPRVQLSSGCWLPEAAVSTALTLSPAGAGGLRVPLGSAGSAARGLYPASCIPHFECGSDMAQAGAGGHGPFRMADWHSRNPNHTHIHARKPARVHPRARCTHAHSDRHPDTHVPSSAYASDCNWVHVQMHVHMSFTTFYHTCAYGRRHLRLCQPFPFCGRAHCCG